MSKRKFGTCFFEQYAQIALSELLGSDYDCLVNKDRPDLQSPDGKTIGIEVTRAMEESKSAEMELLKDVAGITKAVGRDDIGQILESGYGYGLEGGRYVGLKEFSYWSMALPMKRILQSKVSKVGNGFYGNFDRIGLFVFSKDNLDEAGALKAMNYTMSLQKYQDCRYDHLYLADVDDLFVCLLEDGLELSSRLLRYPITQEQRRRFYMGAVERQ